MRQKKTNGFLSIHHSNQITSIVIISLSNNHITILLYWHAKEKGISQSKI